MLSCSQVSDVRHPGLFLKCTLACAFQMAADCHTPHFECEPVPWILNPAHLFFLTAAAG
ncbi:MAG: hypothetical protein ABIL25_03845 [candidate division WOR-3 bacterium]